MTDLAHLTVTFLLTATLAIFAVLLLMAFTSYLGARR